MDSLSIRSTCMSSTNIPARDLLERWPSRRAIAEDARAELSAVHKWFERGAIPPRYFLPLAWGAEARGLPVTLEDITATRAMSDPSEPRPSAEAV